MSGVRMSMHLCDKYLLRIASLYQTSHFLCSKGFAERKILLMHEVVSACKSLHENLARKLASLSNRQRKKVDILKIS